jgi:hypothetical protein
MEGGDEKRLKYVKTDGDWRDVKMWSVERSDSTRLMAVRAGDA